MEFDTPVSYSSWDEFDPEEYGLRCYGSQILDIDRDLINGVKDAIKRIGLRTEMWHRAADIGPGPNLFPAMLLAPFIASEAQGGKLDLIEFSAPNRQYLTDVLTGQERPSGSTRIWGKYETLLAEDAPRWEGALDRVKSLATVEDGNIYDLKPESYDAISAFFVPESITDSREECEEAIAKLVAAVRPGGFIMIGHMLGSTGYPAGIDRRFPGTPLTLTDLRELYEGTLDQLTIIDPPLTREVHEDYHGAAAVVGVKPYSPSRTASMNQRMFTPYDTQACLYDDQRVQHFKQALFEVVKPGDVVVDGGSGTGVLGMIAAQAGASKVYCVELSEEYVEVISQNAKNNGMDDRIIPIHADSTTVVLPEKVDVIVSEVMSGGFFYEPQLQIVANLKRFLKPSGSIVPMVVDQYVELINAQHELYGLDFSYDTRHLALRDTQLTTKSNYLSANFYEETPLSVATKSLVRCMVPGKANAIRVSYTIRLSPGALATVPTEMLLNPQVIFLREPLQVDSGEYYSVSLEYEAGTSPLECAVAVEKL